MPNITRTDKKRKQEKEKQAPREKQSKRALLKEERRKVKAELNEGPGNNHPKSGCYQIQEPDYHKNLFSKHGIPHFPRKATGETQTSYAVRVGEWTIDSIINGKLQKLREESGYDHFPIKNPRNSDADVYSYLNEVKEWLEKHPDACRDRPIWGDKDKKANWDEWRSYLYADERWRNMIQCTYTEARV